MLNMDIITTINNIMLEGKNLVESGRSALVNAVGLSTVFIGLLVASLVLSYLLAKGWSVRPLSTGRSVLKVLVSALLIFLLLMYL